MILHGRCCYTFATGTDNILGSSTYGQVFRGVVQNRLSYHESKKYGYTDAVLVIFPEYNKAHGVAPSKQRVRTAPGLVVVDKDSELTQPFKQKVKEKADQDKIIKLTSDLPVAKDPASASIKPKTPRQKAKESAVVPDNAPQSKQEVAQLAADSGNLSLTPKQLQPGDIIKVAPQSENSPVDGFVHSVNTTDGVTTIDYSYFASDANLPKMGKLQVSEGTASTVKMSVLRPGASTAPEVEAPEAPTTSSDIDELDSTLAALADAPTVDPIVSQGVEDVAAAAVMAAQDIAPQEEAYGGAIVKTIQMADIKYTKNVKSHPFVNIKQLSASDLQLGDLVPQGTSGYNKRYYQIIDIDEGSGKFGNNLYTYRIISDGPTNGQIGNFSPYYTQKNVKRAKNIPANADYVKLISGGDINSGSPITQKADSSLTQVESGNDILAKATTTSSDDFFASAGIPTELSPGVSIQSVGGYYNTPENLYKKAASENRFS
jgi:hypothetical protein